MMFESVLLPAPFSPSSACTSPTAASKSTRSFASTPGNRFVIPRSATAVPCGPAVAAATVSSAALTLGATDDSLHEPAHRVALLDGHHVTLGDAQLPALVVEGAGERRERARDHGLLLRRDHRLRLGRHGRAERREPREAVLQGAVVEPRLPRPVHRG